jgi:PPOX class probable F420-dependent enzyme
MYVNLETYNKIGEPRLTPVVIIKSDGTLYFRTGPRMAKVKRIRKNPRVRIVPSEPNGKPKGTWMEGEAKVVEDEEREHALALFRKENGTVGDLLRRVGYRVFRGQPLSTVISIRLQPQDA